MLAISPLMTTTNGINGEVEIGEGEELLDQDINFDDLFVGFEDGDILPDLEIDSDDYIFADFSFISSSSGEEESGNTLGLGLGLGLALEVVDYSLVAEAAVPSENYSKVEDKDYFISQNDEVISGRTKEEDTAGDNRSGRKTSSTKAGSGGSGSHGHGGKKKKKKAKVDWTPELHRRFVQAVEQLGVDKAVPSRILELMGIDCLTRHNIASHLQKYRSHRKHLLAREAEAASWSQRRQMYSGGGGNTNRVMMKRALVELKNPNWQAAPPPPPIIGFPPPHHQRPLHVWGHPSMQVDRPQLVPVWPRHLSPQPPPPPPPPPWLPLRPAPINGPPPSSSVPDPSYWHYQRALAQGTPCFPPHLLPTMRFQAPVAVPGLPSAHPHQHPHPLFRPVPQITGAATPTTHSSKHSNSQIQLDAHPSNENIDAAIGDVLAKPWSPLPLGLKPPSLESVMVELQRQGVSNVPPTCSGQAS